MSQEQPKRRVEDFPKWELLEDYVGAEAGAALCRVVLAGGRTTLSDGSSIQERLESYERTMATIDAELARRQAQEET